MWTISLFSYVQHYKAPIYPKLRLISIVAAVSGKLQKRTKVDAKNYIKIIRHLHYIQNICIFAFES